MSEGRNSSRHVVLEQLKVMVEFMGKHPELASGALRTMEARHTSKELWSQLAKLLNTHPGGAKKTADGWSKYWSDFKNKLKNKLIETRRRKLSAGAGVGVHKKEVRPFTKLEKKSLAILGPSFERKYLGENGYDDSACDPLPTEIKQESYQDIVTINNDFIKVISENDKLSECGSNNSRQSDRELEEDGEDSGDDPLLNRIYPKWLVDVEKKRAEAELRRAKADELSSEAAVRNAQASLVQAEALKKLAEAVDRQADALMRIAVAFENRRSNDILHIGARDLPGYQ